MLRWLVPLLLAALAGCVPRVTGTFDPRHFADWPIDPAKKLDGCVTVATTPADDASAWRGWATQKLVELPLGVIVREAAVRVLGELFRGGAVRVSGAVGADGCPVVVTPRATRLSWRDHAFGRPELELSVTVEARNASGAPLLARPYDSGKWRADWDPQADAPPVVGTAHVVAQALMLKASADLKAELERAAPPAGSP